MRQVPAPADDAVAAAWRKAAALDISGITADSRHVAPGFLFAALPGSRVDGRDFIAEAVSRGAAAVLAPEGTVWPPGVPPRPLLEDREPRRRLAQLASRFGRDAAAHRGRRHRHQRQDQHGGIPTPDLDGRRQVRGQPGHPWPDGIGVRTRAWPYHAGPGRSGRYAGAAGPRRRAACGDGGVVARPRSVPAGRRAPRCRGVHQSDPRPSGLSRVGSGLSRREAAAVFRTPAGGCAGCGEQRHGWRHAGHACAISLGGGGWRFARSAKQAAQSVCWRRNLAQMARCCASRWRAAGGTSRCHCLAASRPTTP